MTAVPSFPEDLQPGSGPPQGEDTTFLLQTRRERLRRNLLRANTAVAAILCATIVLAFLSVLASIQAGRNQQRAESAEEQGHERLWRSYVAQARAARLSGIAGRSREALGAARLAAAIRPSIEVRDEAIACLSMPDLLPGARLAEVSPEDYWIRGAPGAAIYLAGSDFGPIQVRDAADGARRFTLDLVSAGLGPRPDRDRRVTDGGVSPDGKHCVLVLKDGSLAVWSLVDGRLEFTTTPSRAGTPGFDFTPDSESIAFHNLDRGGALRVVRLSDGRSLPQAASIQSQPFSFQPGTRLITLAETNQLVWLDRDTGERVRTAPVPMAIRALTWSLDGKKLAATAEGNDIFLWNFETRQFHQLRAEAELRWSLVFSPDSRHLLAGFGDNVTHLYDCAQGRERVWTKEGIGLAFSADSKEVFYFHRRTRFGRWKLTDSDVFRIETGAGNRGHKLLTMDLSRDGRWLATLQPKGLELWDLQGGGSRKLFEFGDLRSFAFFPDNESLLICRIGRLEKRRIQVRTASEPGARPRREVILGPPETIPLPANLSVLHLALSADGRVAALDLQDLRIAILDLTRTNSLVFLETGATMTFTLGSGVATGSGRFAVSPEGRWVALGYGPQDRMPTVFDCSTGKLVSRLSKSSGTVAFSPDGNHLIVGGGDGYSLYRVGTWEKVWHRMDPGVGGQWGCMTFDAGGRWVALSSRRHLIQLLDMKDGTQLATLTPPELMNLSGLRMSFDSSVLAAATQDNFVQLWDLAGMRRSLGSLGLDWGRDGDPAPTHASRTVAKSAISTPLAVALVGLGAASLVAILALVVLRRHQSLAQGLVQTEERSIRQQRELEVQREVSRLKSNFVSMVSHEFRTPLSVIISSTEILRDYLPRLTEEKRRRQFDTIVDAAERMRELIDEVLLLGKVESGRLECQPRLLEVRPLCERLVAEVMAAQQGRNPIEVQAQVEGVLATLDQNLVEIILSNLLSNAVKYSPAGAPVTLKFRKEGSALVFDVEDRGIGIPSFDQASLFSPFRRGSNVGKVPGTGLGLAIVQKCVQQHGGKIEVRSDEGEGTVFTVWLPGPP